VIVSDVAIRNRTAVAMLALLIVVAGVYSYITLPREAAPDVPIPYIVITTPYGTVSPQDIESSVTMKIEKKLTGLKGVKEVKSTSSEGLSSIVVEFDPAVKVEDALQRVRDKVSQARGDLPDNADLIEPTITDVNVADFPIMTVNLTGDLPPDVMKELADRLQDKMEAVRGVQQVNVIGTMEPEIRLEFDHDRVAAYGLTVAEILKLIPSENVNVSAGGLETSPVKFNIRIQGEFKNAEQIFFLPLTYRNGKPIYLADVANTRGTFKDRLSFARVDGRPSVTLSIQKRVGGNIIQIADDIKQILADDKPTWPAGIDYAVTQDRSKDIRSMVADLENHIMTGLVLVVGVLLLFLGWRPSLIVALAIPLSLMISFAAMVAIGFTLNMIVLFSLIMVLGMLVDDAIVVVENIYRHMQMGYSRLDAAILGTREVAWPVITSTLTKIAAFAPMAFWPGMMGSFMKYLPITLVITLFSSLLVAMVINPTICAVLGGKMKHRTGDTWFMRGYKRFVHGVVTHRVVALTLVLMLLMSLGIVYFKYGHGLEFFPDADPKRAMINLRAPQGTNVEHTNLLAREVEARIEKYREHFDHVVTNVGTSGGNNFFTAGDSGPHVATITMVFRDFEQRTRPSSAVVADIRKELTDIVGAEVKVEKEKGGPPTGAPVTVRISGEDFGRLAELAAQARNMIARTSGLVNLRSDLEAARPELQFVVDRARAAQLNVNTATIGGYLKTTIAGAKVSTYRIGNDEYDITVRLPVSQRDRIDEIERLRVPAITGAQVPLGSLGRFVYVGGKGTITRIDQRRVVTVTADNEGRLTEAVLADVMTTLDAIGPTTLTVADVKDYGPLAAMALSDKADFKLDSRTRRAAEALLGAGGDSDERNKSVVLAAVNAAMSRVDLFGEARLKAMDLPAQGRELMKDGVAKLDQKQTSRLNRLAMEQAFPQAVRAGERLEMPRGYEVKYAGEKEEQLKAMWFLLKALAVALLLIWLVLVAQFNTISVPIVIMSTVLLSLVGVLVGLLVHALPVGVIMTGVGIISLTGVVVANGIVLLDFTRELQRRGRDVVSAAVEASAIRLRPVLLTAVTAILGLLPMATGVSFDFHHLTWATSSESSQWWRSMAVAVIYGLAFATVLTLVVVPSFYVMLYRFAARLGFGGIKPVADPASHQPAEHGAGGLRRLSG
jgi:multidrug efflux pump subunit AcrB